MRKAIVLIDGENFLHKINEILTKKKSKKKVHEIKAIKLKELITESFKHLKDIEISQINYYAAKLSVHEPSKEKSLELIAQQRTLKNMLEKNGSKFLFSGHVRAQEVGKDKYVFKEKGVDVQVAVDLVSASFDKTHDVIILCSSDSDLQPAVREARKRGAHVIYLGFKINPNKGLKVTTNQSVMFEDKEILSSIEFKK